MIHLPAVSETTTRSPVELEWAIRVRDHGSIQLQGFACSIGVFKVNEAITRITSAAYQYGWVAAIKSTVGSPRELITNHLDVDLVAHANPEGAHKVFVDPWLKLTHPDPH